MKVKLLKKIRKRFVLEYVEWVDYHPTWTKYELFKIFNMKPFYWVYDTIGWHSGMGFKTKNEAIDYIFKIVKKDWYNKIKGTRQRAIKIQY